MTSTPSLSRNDVLRARQISLLLDAPDVSTPHDVAAWLGALQAQDVASGAWSLGVRLPGTTAAVIDEAFERGEVLRTWPMRGTIHIVPPEDVRWMLELTGSRALASTARNRRERGLDDDAAERAVSTLTQVLQGGTRRTRADLLAALAEEGIPVDGQAGYHAILYAAHVGEICFGPLEGRQPTYVRLADWAPHQRLLDRDASLTELAWRYFRGHGPTTINDFAGWSGLTLTDSRAAVAANAGRLVPAVVGDSTVWMSAPVAARIADGLAPGPSHALPGFDEFMLGYKDRSIQAPAAHLDAIVPGGNGVFRSTICLDGRAVATWTRTVRRARIDVTILPFAPLDGAQHAAAVDALQRYGDFLGLPIALA